ncbi:hypothetical protein ONZ45_g16916 [Pleurotus djamor]|nr:hypothetical protein ONZ45_g16916 [Pleurotus djamor]
MGEYQVGEVMGGNIGRMKKKPVELAFRSNPPTMDTCVREYPSLPLPRSVDVDEKPFLWILDLMYINHPLDGSLLASYLHMNVQPLRTSSGTLCPCAASSSIGCNQRSTTQDRHTYRPWSSTTTSQTFRPSSRALSVSTNVMKKVPVYRYLKLLMSTQSTENPSSPLDLISEATSYSSTCTTTHGYACVSRDLVVAWPWIGTSTGRRMVWMWMWIPVPLVNIDLIAYTCHLDHWGFEFGVDDRTYLEGKVVDVQRLGGLGYSRAQEVLVTVDPFGVKLVLTSLGRLA